MSFPRLLLFLNFLWTPSLFGAPLYTGATVLPLSAPGPAYHAPGYLLVTEAGFIAAVGPGSGQEDPAVTAARAAPDFQEVDLTGKLLMPGFVSGHSHLWQSVFRGIAPDQELPGWLQALHYTYGVFLEPGDMAAFTRHGAFDQLRHGVTTTYNHSHFLGRNYALYPEQLEAELTTPQRFIFAWVNDPQGDDAQWHRALAPWVQQIKPSPASSLLGLSLNVMGLYRGEDYLRREVALARTFGLTLQTHYLEPAVSQEGDRAKWPLFVRTGALSPQFSFAHFIHTDDAILRDTAAAGAAMIWNPLSNGRLGSGLPAIEKYLDLGVRVGMGVDGQASADLSDPFENTRFGLYALRLRRENASGLQPLDLLRLHTLNTAEVLGVAQWVGSLEPGKFADFLVVDPTQPSTGPIWDPVATLVFACNSRHLETVFIGGRAVVRRGEVLDSSAAPLAREVEQRILALRARQANSLAPSGPR